MARLCYSRGSSSSRLELADFTSLGSDLFCDVYLPDAQVAKRHAEVHHLADGRFQLVHVCKDNRTYLNGASVTKAMLRDGDEIIVGATALRFEDPALQGATEVAVKIEEMAHEVALRVPLDGAVLPVDAALPTDPGQAAEHFCRLQLVNQLFQGMVPAGNDPGKCPPGDAEAALDRLLDSACRLFDADRAAALLFCDGTLTPVCQRARARGGGSSSLRLARGALEEAVRQRQCLVGTDAFGDVRFDAEQGVLVADIRSSMLAPLFCGDRLVGAIHLDSTSAARTFDASDAERLAFFAQQAAVVAANALGQAELRRCARELQEAKEATDQALGELQERSEELERMVVRDALTQLYNHAYLLERLEEEIRRSKRYHLQFALVLVDIDKFSEVNKYFGQGAGDRLLKQLADVLLGNSRGADACFRPDERDLTMRFGGDRFTILLPETSKRGGAAKAERLRAAINQFDFTALGLPRITVSSGVAAFGEDAQDRVGIITAAEVALAAAKQAGRDQTVAYAPTLRRSDGPEDAGQKYEVERVIALERVIRNRALRYVYQPIVAARLPEIFAYEALCRPTDSAFGNPLELLEAAEDNGRIRELGSVMRELAIETLGQLPSPRHMFVNLHPLELTEELCEWGECCQGAERIVLEVTECAEITSYDRVRGFLRQLKQHGFRIALDDLGAGYSGLNALALLEPDFVKLDMKLVRNINVDARTARLVKYLLDFAVGEGMQVVAEGIETAVERRVVTDLGCHYLQGYLFAKPSPPFCEVAASVWTV